MSYLSWLPPTSVTMRMSWHTYRQDASTTPSWRHHWSKTLLTQRPSYRCKCWLSSARCWLDRGWVVLPQPGETAPPHGCLRCCQVVLQQNGVPRIQEGNCPGGDYHRLLWKRHRLHHWRKSVVASCRYYQIFWEVQSRPNCHDVRHPKTVPKILRNGGIWRSLLVHTTWTQKR